MKTKKDNIGTNNKLLEDIYCRQLLSDLFEGFGHLTITKSSMSFFAIAMILNDIQINNRRTIIEFGSGLSTVLIARLIKKNKLPCKIFSVEHDEKWLNLLNSILVKENMHEYVINIHAPLCASDKSKNNLEWYNENEINKHIPENSLFDLVIIDGPPAHEKSKSLSRYPALPYIINNINKSYSIYVDDASRNGEQEVLKFWKEEFNISHSIINDRIALCSNDEFIQYSCLPC